MAKDKNDFKIANVITDSLADPIKTILSEYAEISVDEILTLLEKDGSILQKIPIVSSIISFIKVGTTLQNIFLLQKYAIFIGQINKSNNDSFFVGSELTKLYSNKKARAKIMEVTFIMLDRYQTKIKAKVLGELFVQTLKKRFTIGEYSTLVYSIELMHPYRGFESLKEFYHSYIDMSKISDKTELKKHRMERANLDYSALSTTGLLNLPKGAAVMGNLGGASLNDLGIRFYELAVLPFEQDGIFDA
jgi:hypothetical protein